MERLKTQVDSASDAYADNVAAMQTLVSELSERRSSVREGGRGVARQRELGKLPVRERLDLVLDPGTPFLEIGGLAAWEMYEGAAPSAGMVAGVGMTLGQSA
jgi:3-methylcrotonyl-CoA carboxylase beta subunit